MKKQDVKSETKSRLGGGTAHLGIRDTTIDKHIDTALRLFTRYKPKQVIDTMAVTEGGIVMPATTLQVVKVYPVSFDNRLTAGSNPYDVFNIQIYSQLGGSFGSIGEVLADRQHRQTEQNLISAPSWRYEPNRQLLYLTARWGTEVTVAYVTTYVNVEDLNESDIVWVLDYVEALSLTSEGRLRRKYQNDFLQMDGSEMVSEGLDKRGRLEEDLRGQMIYNFGSRA